MTAMAGKQEDSFWDRSWDRALQTEPSDQNSDTLENHIDRLKVEFLADVLPEEGRAVEMGCGSARLLARIGGQTDLELVAVDSSPSALALAGETARRIGRPITLLACDVRAVPLAEGSCALVLSGGLLEHFEDPKPVLSEMVRVLEPGGLFYADVVPRTLSLYRWRSAWRMVRSPWMRQGVYESSLGARYYVRALEELGCNDVSVQSCGVYPAWRPRAFSRWTRSMDGSCLARWLGWYFMIRARKP